MAKILCVCISKERKTCSQNIHECEADLQGLVGDVHYGMGGRKQVSLLPYEKVKEYFEQSEEEFRYGRFGENLLVEGIDWNSIAEGNRFRCGEVLLEAVRIGAGGPASDAYKGEKVCTPMEPWFVFCQILEAGRLREENHSPSRDEKYVILQQWAEYYDVIAISKILKTIWFIKNKALMEYLSDIIL